MPRVFIPSMAVRKTPDGVVVPVYDFSQCNKYGDVRIIFTRGLASADDIEHAIMIGSNVLEDFCDDDSIVATGDPAAIGLAVMFASRNNDGRVAMLRWDRYSRNYQRIILDLSRERNPLAHA